MKQIILVDGENLVHNLLSVLRDKKPTIKRDDLLAFSLRAFLTKASSLDDKAEIVYFGTKLKLNAAPKELIVKVESIRAFQAKWTNHLRAQGIEFEKAGYLRAREGDSCVKCGNPQPYLLEKGVDVALAVRVVSEAQPGAEIVIVSSDTDLLPAVRVGRENGAKVTYLGFDEDIILALAATASATRVFTRTAILSAAGMQ